MSRQTLPVIDAHAPLRAPADFGNPTVYCADQLRLIDHIRDRVFADLRPALPPTVG